MTDAVERSAVLLLPQSLRMVRIGLLAVHPRNPKDHDIGALSESMRDGFYGALTVWQRAEPLLGVDPPDGRYWVLAGAGRIETALATGADASTELPAIFVDCDAVKAGKMLLADNRLPELGGFIEHKLVDALEAQRAAAIASGIPVETALSGTGYDDQDLDALKRALAAPTAFVEFDASLETEHECPRCHYQWSGAAKPKKKTRRKKPDADAESAA